MKPGLFLTLFLAAVVVPPVSATAPASPGGGTWELLHGCTLESGGFDNGLLHVVHGGKTHRFRLYFADPLAGADDGAERRDDQARYYQADGTVLAAEASAVAQSFLRGGFEVLTKREGADGGESADASFALFRRNGRYLSTKLVEDGLARIHGLPPVDAWPGGEDPVAFLSALKRAERRAQAAGAGIWSAASGSPQMAGRALALPDGAGSGP